MLWSLGIFKIVLYFPCPLPEHRRVDTLDRDAVWKGSKMCRRFEKMTAKISSVSKMIL